MRTAITALLAGVCVYALTQPMVATRPSPADALADATAGTASAAPLALAFAAVAAPSVDGAMAPQLRTAPDGSVLMSWIEPAADGRKALRWSRFRDARWSPAATIVTADNFFANWADVPSIIQLSDGRLAAHWLRKSASSTYAYHVAVSLSRDEGKSWSDPVAPHSDRSDTEHGFVTMFERTDGTLGMVWLDGRQMAAPETHGDRGAAASSHDGGHGDGHGDTGAMTLRATTISREGVPALDVALDARVCECCPTTAAVTSKGVVAAFRDRGDTEVRDIGVARFDGRAWTTPTLVHADNWTINACPVNGPSLAARGERVALAWFTAANNAPRVSVAFSSDAGATFGQPIAISDTAAVGRVDAELLDDGSALVLWLEHDPAKPTLRMKRAWPDGRTTASQIVTPLSTGRGSGYPRMALSGSTLVVAWTEPATTTTPSMLKTVMAPLPR